MEQPGFVINARIQSSLSPRLLISTLAFLICLCQGVGRWAPVILLSQDSSGCLQAYLSLQLIHNLMDFLSHLLAFQPSSHYSLHFLHPLHLTLILSRIESYNNSFLPSTLCIYILGTTSQPISNSNRTVQVPLLNLWLQHLSTHSP